MIFQVQYVVGALQALPMTDYIVVIQFGGKFQ